MTFGTTLVQLSNDTALQRLVVSPFSRKMGETH